MIPDQANIVPKTSWIPKEDDIKRARQSWYHFRLYWIMLLASLGCSTPETEMVPSLSTDSVLGITTESATVLVEVVDDGGQQILERGVVWAVSPGPNLLTSFEADEGKELGEFSIDIIGLQPNTAYYVRGYSTNKIGTGYGNEIVFLTEPIVRDFDGNPYSVKTIGNQSWMTENLRTTHYDNGEPIDNPGSENELWMSNTSGAYSWYENDQALGKVYGRLYNWPAVNRGGLCPAGWKVPTDGEWTILEEYLIANGYNFDGSVVGNKIAKSLAHSMFWSTSDETGAVGNSDFQISQNRTGFTALPGGFRGSDGTFGQIEDGGGWWTSSEMSEVHGLVQVYLLRLRRFRSKGRE